MSYNHISVFLRRLEQWKKSHPRRKGFTAADFGQQIAREIGGDVTGGAVKKIIITPRLR